MIGIYKITNTENGKVYIGQSKDLKHRKACHFFDLKNNRHNNAHLQRAYNINPNVFTFEVLCECKIEDLNDLEIFFIKKHNACDDKYGYNIAQGGNCAQSVSEETKKKISQSKIGNTIMRGRKLSAEWRQHLGEAQPHRKRIECVETGQIFDSFADAARKTKLNRTKIVSVCTGKRKTTGGLHFKYVDKSASD